MIYTWTDEYVAKEEISPSDIDFEAVNKLASWYNIRNRFRGNVVYLRDYFEKQGEIYQYKTKRIIYGRNGLKRWSVVAPTTFEIRAIEKWYPSKNSGKKL